MIRAHNVSNWPEVVPWSDERFSLCVMSDEDIDASTFATRAIEQGLATVTAWGPNCADVEDTIDWAIVDASIAGNSPGDPLQITTTSHVGQELSDTLSFFFHTAAHDVCWVVFAVGPVADRVEIALHALGAEPA